jgi:N6-adenosine-specific RNA methylase IME4
MAQEKFSIIYADCPWDYKGQTQHSTTAVTGGAISHYPTLTLAELKLLDVRSVCEDNSLLFLWTSSPHLDQAIELMKAWGFQYKTIAFVWEKQRANPGYYTLSECEICIVGKRGKIPSPRGSRKERQFLSKLRGAHSQKPNEIRERITRMFPTQKKLEMFARAQTAGWSVFGNEVEGGIQIPNSSPPLHLG